MSSVRAARLKSWLKRSRKTTGQPASTTTSGELKQFTTLSNPVENYYRHKAKTNLAVFYRFALQTRSLTIRDVFAKVASPYGWDLGDLLAVLENLQTENPTEPEKRSMAAKFDSAVLLTLADLLENTARDDLDTKAAVQIYDFVHEVFGEEPFLDQHILQYVEALNELGLYERSDRLAKQWNVNELAPLQIELLQLQRIRHTTSSVELWLKALNDLYSSLGMTNVQLLDDDSLPLMDRLGVGSTQGVDGPKVSVIMPTFSPGPGIRTAIRSLLEQSWRNLEIIVVDDASPSEHRHYFDDIKKLDSRIRVLHQEHNLGSYAARNAGLAIATGEFVTTHDDDDWSHPDKITNQVKVLLQQPEIVATTSAHIRTTEDLAFRRLNMKAKFMQMNYSSLMFRRNITEEIGHWDRVNRGGDSEFYLRLSEYVGADRVVDLGDKPLSFSRVWQGSLTSGEMSRGFFAYPRLLFRWAFRQWHWDVAKEGRKAVRTGQTPRPYPIPTTFEAGARNEDLGLFDVVYVTDYFRQAKYVDYVVKELETLSDQGLRVGYMHMSSPETTRPAGFPKKLFQLQYEENIIQISHNDIAETKLLLVYDPAIGMFADQASSTLVCHRGIAIAHTLPTLTRAEPRSPSNFHQVLRNLDHCFNTTFQVVGASVEDQNRLRQAVPEARVLPDDLIWRTHIRERPGEIIPPTKQPIVGFHTYGNQYRWPNSVEQFKTIYGASQFTTQFFGSIDSAKQRFGEGIFGEIDAIESAAQNEDEFLRHIDFWVYYPHPRLEDRIWEPVLNAMQAGKVVVLPERLVSLYGDAAVYEEPSQVEKTVVAIANDPQRYIRQAERGQTFVERCFSRDVISKRIYALMRE